MNRRNFLFGLTVGPLAAALAAEAQQADRVPRIGMLMPVPSADAAPNIEAFRQGLRQLGYVEGQSIVIESRFADGRTEPLPDLAAELVRLKVKVIVTWSTPAARAAMQATQTIPIVMAAATDPVGTGLVASLSRPGGNLTGVAADSHEYLGKNLELLKERNRLEILMPGPPRRGPSNTGGIDRRAVGREWAALRCAPQENEARSSLPSRRPGRLMTVDEFPEQGG